MGVWAQKWLRRDIVEDRNLDPDIFFWELRRFALSQGHKVERRKVVEFSLRGMPAERRFFWLVFEPDDSVDVWTAAGRTFRICAAGSCAAGSPRLVNALRRKLPNRPFRGDSNDSTKEQNVNIMPAWLLRNSVSRRIFPS